MNDTNDTLTQIQEQLNKITDTLVNVVNNQVSLAQKVDVIERNTTTAQIATNHISHRVDEVYEIMAVGFSDTQKVIQATQEVAAATQLNEGSTFGMRKEISDLKTRMATLEQHIKASGDE